jgi:LuxR family transcriptional regulator, maltose regulon positive regulatory protein
MSRSFRFEPPTPRPGSLTRPRLLRALLGRWEHRVTTVVGGPGLGKTTLLTQAVAENLLAPRGEDVWIGLGRHDADGDAMARDVMAAVLAHAATTPPAGADPTPDPTTAAGLAPNPGRRPGGGLPPEPPEHPAGGGDDPPTPAAVADAVWRLAPTPVCLVLDDGHCLERDSDGAAWLAELVDVMPENGHVLVASRWAPPVPLARLVTQGEVLRLSEDDLRFSPDELAGFAARRGIDPDRLSLTGGWPAMAELAAAVTGDMTGEYLWEEVLEPLGTERRRVLAVLSDLGGADDGLAEATLGTPVDLDRALDGVPLMALGAGGWRVPHPLWRTVPALALDDEDRRTLRRRAIAHLVARERFDEAVTLATEAGLGTEVPDILRAACIRPLRPPTRRLDSWLADLPDDARGTPGAALAAGLRAAVATPGEATEPLRRAMRVCREAGDAEAELSAIAVLGRVAWWRSDLGLLAELYVRILELEAGGLRSASGIAGVGRAVIADLDGGDDDVLRLLDAIEPGALDGAWQAMADWLRATILVGRGDAAEARAVLDAIRPGSDPAFRMTVEGTRLMASWAEGRIDDVVATLVPLLDSIRAAGVMQNVTVGLAQTAYLFGAVGDPDRARPYLDEARRAAAEAGTGFPVRLSLAEASILLAEGDEAAAADSLHAGLANSTIDGPDRRLWRIGLPLTYVLVPETRAPWDAAPLRGHLALSRSLATAVVALREGRAGASSPDTARRALDGVDVSDPAAVRATLHHRFAVTLALGLEAADRPEAGPLLESLGPAGREAVRTVAAQRSQTARPARSLLAAVPAPPRQTTEIRVLGALEIVRDGEPVVENELRRERVRALLAYLTGHRTTTRAAITAALWPDLDEPAAANNLRVTLTYFLRLVEPWRSARESSYFVRLDGPHVALVTGDRLRIDLDRFDDHLARAARAETEGAPSIALDHNLAAVDLYRGDLHDGVADAEWFSLDRERAKARFVAAATRAGQLLAARGDADEAERVAHRAVAVDRWAESAYGVLVSAALARGDRSAARRALDRSLAALDELGVEPSEETSRLRRRLRSS